MSTYTQWYWKIDLHNLLHFLKLRIDPHAQYEIRAYAEVMAGMVKRVAPLSYEAWIDYDVAGAAFSRGELDVLRELLHATSDEIRATLLGTADRYPGRRRVVVFQPHTYSRTALLLEDYNKGVLAPGVVAAALSTYASGTALYVSTTVYQSSGPLNTQSVTSPGGETVTFGYDAAGRQTSVTEPGNIVTSTTDDALNRVRFDHGPTAAAAMTR